jgi:hypothetical protein
VRDNSRLLRVGGMQVRKVDVVRIRRLKKAGSTSFRALRSPETLSRIQTGHPNRNGYKRRYRGEEESVCICKRNEDIETA